MRTNRHIRRFWALLAVWLLCLSWWGGVAAEVVTPSVAPPKGADYTANKAVAAALDTVFATYGPGTYFTYDGKGCTDHDQAYCAASGAYDCNCRRVLEDGTDLLAWQCFGYARYVFYTCFGFIDNAYVGGGRYHSLGSIPQGELTVDNVKALLTRGKAGAHIRVAGHSMALLSTDTNGVTVIHANTDNQCGVALQTFTWQAFIDLYQWRGIEYVNMPNEYPGDDTQVLPTITTNNVEEGIYTLENVSTGRMLQVSGGKDADETPVNTGAAVKDSLAQQFKLVYTDKGRYYLCAMCSSDGENRVLDVIRATGGSMTGGNKLEIYRAVDADAQLFRLVPLEDGSWVIEIAAASNIVVTDQATTTTQITAERYTGAALQRWQMTRIDGQPPVEDERGVYTVTVDEGSVLNMRSEASTAGTILAKIPNGTVLSVQQTDNNWGYVTYKGIKGWISLDYAQKSALFGDVDGNGRVEAADALQALQGATQKITLSVVAVTAADVTLDGTVTSADALNILQYATGKIQSPV